MRNTILPPKRERLTNMGIASEAFRRFLLGVAENAAAPAEYDSLSQVQTFIPNPSNNLYIMVNGQGLARYKSSASQWVLTSDDTTPVT
jgi:hypothetical protein